jgi:hypothetical protein
MVQLAKQRVYPEIRTAEARFIQAKKLKNYVESPKRLPRG